MEKIKKKSNLELIIFYTAVLIGGFGGGYAMLRCSMFASSQTMNFITMLLNILGNSFEDILVRIAIVILYGLAIALTVLIPRYTKLDLKIVSVYINIIAAAIMACAPADYAGVPVLLPMFFAMAFQWGSYKGAMGYVSTCIFSTNNFRMTVEGGVNYLCTKDKKYIKQFAFYLGTLVMFFVGIILCYICVRTMGFRSIALVIVPAVFMHIMLMIEKKTEIKEITEEEKALTEVA